MKHEKDVKDYAKAIREYLKERYGEVKPEWETIIVLLADDVQLYKQCLMEITKHGIYDANKGIKNPLLSTVKDYQATIIKLVKELGLSPLAASKINDIGDEDEDDFIEALTGGGSE